MLIKPEGKISNIIKPEEKVSAVNNLIKQIKEKIPDKKTIVSGSIGALGGMGIGAGGVHAYNKHQSKKNSNEVKSTSSK
jgi:hypothetical protein